MNKMKFICCLLISMSLFSPMAIAATDDECTGAWCTGIGWVDNLGDETWWLEQVDSAGNSIEESLANQVQDQIKAIGLSYIQSFVPFLSIGSSGPSALELAVERILASINQAETNIIDAIIAESVAQNGIDWAALKFNTAYYFSFSDHAEKESLITLLDDLLLDSTALRIEFQQNRMYSNPNRDFDTYNYDAFHAYLNVVALETLIMIEHVRMTKIIANPSVSDAEIQSQVYTDLALLFNPDDSDSVFSYVAWLDNNWRNASDARFPESASYKEVIRYFDTAHLVQVEDYRALFGNYCNAPEQNAEYIYSYKMDGTEYEVKTKYWHQGSYADETEEVCRVVVDSFGEIIASTPGSIRLAGEPIFAPAWMQYMANRAMQLNQERSYPLFLERGFGPAREILDSWWNLAGFAGNRPYTQADNFLDNPITDLTPPYCDWVGFPVNGCAVFQELDGLERVFKGPGKYAARYLNTPAVNYSATSFAAGSSSITVTDVNGIDMTDLYQISYNTDSTSTGISVGQISSDVTLFYDVQGIAADTDVLLENRYEEPVITCGWLCFW